MFIYSSSSHTLSLLTHPQPPLPSILFSPRQRTFVLHRCRAPTLADSPHAAECTYVQNSLGAKADGDTKSGGAGATRLPPNTRAGLLASRAALVGRGRRFGSSDPGSVTTESHHHWRTESSYANASASAMQPTPSDLQQHSEAFTEGGAHLRVS